MPLDERHANDMTLANRVSDLDLAIGDPVAWLSRDGRHITDQGTVLYVDRFSLHIRWDEDGVQVYSADCTAHNRIKPIL